MAPNKRKLKKSHVLKRKMSLWRAGSCCQNLESPKKFVIFQFKNINLDPDSDSALCPVLHVLSIDAGSYTSPLPADTTIKQSLEQFFPFTL